MKKKTKKMVDIIRPISAQLSKKEKEEKEVVLKKIEKDLKKIDRQVERFETRQEEQFKEEDTIKKKKRIPFKAYALLGLLVILLGAGIYSAIELLPRAKIKITTKKTEWSYVDAVVAGKEIVKIDVNQKQMPAEVFSIRKNFNFSFPATGKKSVERKAGGKITIFNVYSSDPQLLVVNTRFSTPDGKMFRLDKKIVVPGAKIIEGKITASTIEATVIADQPGPQYNIGPTSHFSIPGFQGSVKYQGFYASSQEPMTGGFIGEVAFPTEEDIKKAKEKAVKSLHDYVDSFLSLQIPPEFKIIEGSKQFNVLKEEINQEVNEKGDFTIFSDGELLVIAFKESDLKELMEVMVQNSLGSELKMKTYKLEYGAGRADFKQGKISFAVNFQGVFEQPIDVEIFKKTILDKEEKGLKALVASSPNIQKVTISLWPFWVKRVPNDIKRVKVEVE